MIDYYESRYDAWKRAETRKAARAHLRQLPAWLAVIGLGCAVVALAAVIGRGV